MEIQFQDYRQWCVEALDDAARFWCEDVARGLLGIDMCDRLSKLYVR
jgi:hypothetical protein